MDDRPIYFVIYHKAPAVNPKRWVRYGLQEFNHILRAKEHLSALQREYPHKAFSVRQKRWRGRVHQPTN